MITRPLLALVAKDLRVFFSDRHAVILSFLAPIALASFMAAVFGGAGAAEGSRIPIAVVDEDGGVISSAIVAGARAEPGLVASPATRERGLAAVRTGEAVVAVVIGRGFGRAASEALLGDGDPPELLLYRDPTHRSDASLAQGLLARVVLEGGAAESLGDLGGDLLDGLAAPRPSALAAVDGPVERAEFLSLLRLDRPEAGEAGLDEDRDEFVRAFPGLGGWFPPGGGPSASEKGGDDGSTAKAKRGGGLKMPYAGRELSIVAGGAGGERRALAAHAFAGMVVQFVLFSAVEWGIGLLTERQRGLWKRLRVAPVSRGTLMASKVLGCFLASIMIIAAVFGFGAAAFGFRVRGDLAGLLLLASAFAWMASNFGLMVAALGRSPQGARAVAVLAVLILVMLGGGWIPSFLFPAWLQRLTPAIPTRWAIDGFDGVLSRQYSLAEATPSILVLAAFGAGFGVLAMLTYRRPGPG